MSLHLASSSSSSQLSLHLKPCLQPSLLSSNRLLDSLSKSGRLDDARRLFDQMPHRDDFTWNTMIAAYARSGLLPDALRLFRTAPHCHTSSVPWSSLISGLSRHGRGPDALLLFARMRARGFPPDPYSLGAVLRACSNHSLLGSGEQAHTQALKTSLAADAFVAAGLVDMYGRCGRLSSAAHLFDSVPPAVRGNRVLWTAMVVGHALNGDGHGAMEQFRRMRAEGVLPNDFTLPSVLAACAGEAALGLGRQVHGCAVRLGFQASPFVQSSLVGMYAKCSDLCSAKRVLESCASDDSVSWNTLIVSCSRSGLHHDALSLFDEMHRRGMEMDEFTYPSALNSAASGGDASNGRLVHGLVLKSGLENHRHVGNALVDMYTKCRSLDCAREMFDRMPERDVVTWTSLIVGLSHESSHEAAFRLYCEMRAAGVNPDEFVVAGVLGSCAGLAVLELGRQVHAAGVTRGLDSFVSVGNSLVSMYAKCGCVDDAQRVFDLIPDQVRDAITWTALIVGYAKNGRGRDSVQLYDRMVRAGSRPDYVTFIGVLFACSHAGLVEVGRSHFESMEPVHRVVPGPEHYACLIDLLGRAGQTGEAAKLIDRMGVEPDATVWKALLAACRVHRDVALAERAAKRLLELVPTDAVPYVLLANLYSSSGRWGDVARIRGMMRSRRVSKEPGCSWIEAGGGVHVFHAEDRAHPRVAEVYAKVVEMMERIRAVGYVADTGWALQDVEEEGKEQGLAYHSEKLAVAFGLVSLPLEATVRVYKNLRVCGDCHTAIKLVAAVYEREIVLRDGNCFHHFSEGKCSCGDYW